MLNLRLLGVMLTSKPVARLARELAPWIFVSLIIILSTGVLLFASEAMKAYASVPFQVKMLFLFSAMIFHYTLYRRLTRSDDDRDRSASGAGSPPLYRYCCGWVSAWAASGIGFL